MIYFNKVLPMFVLPLGFTIILMVAGLVLQRRVLVWVALSVLWISSTPLVSTTLMRAAEGWAERAVATDVANADAIVVLSGRRVVAPGAGATSEWNDPDRFFGGVELFELGKAPLLVFTGAPHSWAGLAFSSCAPNFVSTRAIHTYRNVKKKMAHPLSISASCTGSRAL